MAAEAAGIFDVVVAVLASSQISGEFRRYVVQRDITILKDAPETRMFYGLERLWGSAERIEVPAAR